MKQEGIEQVYEELKTEEVHKCLLYTSKDSFFDAKNRNV